MIITNIYCITSSVIIYVGAGLYADRRMDDSDFDPRPIANNSLIVSGSDGLRLYCVSNSSQSGVGTITASNGSTLNFGSTDVWNLVNLKSRPGFLRLQTPRDSSNNPVSLTASDQSIYTCNIPDDNGNDFIFNVGLYPYNFDGTHVHSRTLFNTVFSPTTDSPTIMSLTYDEESSSVICISTRSPATVASWMKDEDIIDESSTDYTLTQTVTNRTTSTYTNVLTIHVGASVVGTYICNVSNELGSDFKEVVTLGELIV